MIHITRRVLAVLLVAGIAVGGAACAKKQAEEAPAPSPAAALSVTDVELGRAIGGDKRVTDKTDNFAPNDVIYAAVLTSGTSANASLKARWTFEDGQVVNETSEAIAPTADAATEFHISKPNGWPKGKYKVEIFLDGTSVQTKDFEVK